jgi:hypothetical protein
MTTNFTTFLQNIIVENLHPELQNIVKSNNTNKSKQSLIATKIKDLTNRGESTGIEGNMPKGSSRAYLKHADKHDAVVDGKKVKLATGTKVAIKSSLDRFHNHKEHDGLSLGAMQNRAENNDHWVNNHYRTLTHDHETGEYHTNHEGIFPPLIVHDEHNHEWAHVGHARDVKDKEFKELTKSKEYPKGISHSDFYHALNRQHEMNNGKYWKGGDEHENHMRHVSEHPLVQKFMDYHNNTGNPTYDYAQIKNLGVWEHPNGSKHIVARDHGYNTEVMHAYANANKRKYKSNY